MQPAKRLSNVPPYLFAQLGQRIAKLRTQGVDVIRLDIGSPDMPPDDEIIEAHVSANHGQIVRPRGEGDSRFAVFSQAGDAVGAAVEIQNSFAEATFNGSISLKVRIGMHTGAADLRMGDYYGSAVNRCARIRGVGHGGQ